MVTQRCVELISAFWKVSPVGREFNTCPACPWARIWVPGGSSSMTASACRSEQDSLSQECCPLSNQDLLTLSGPKGFQVQQLPLWRFQRHLNPLEFNGSFRWPNVTFWFKDWCWKWSTCWHCRFPKRNYPKSTESHQQLEGTRHRLSRVI